MTDRFRSALLLAATRTLLPLIAVTACHNNRDRGMVPPEVNPLAGTWSVTSTTTTDTCNLGLEVRPINGPFAIQGGALSFTIAPACCTNSPLGIGTLDGSAFTIETRRQLPASATCTWQIDEADAGTTDELGFSGSGDLTVTALGDCGPGFPCEVRGGISAVRCPSIGACGYVCAVTCTRGL